MAQAISASIPDESQLRREFEQKKMAALAFAIGVDLLGMGSYLLPIFGEGFDAIWAPIAMFANFAIHGGIIGFGGGLATLAEELMPFTDIIPSVTLTWVVRYVLSGESAYRKFVKKKLG